MSSGISLTIPGDIYYKSRRMVAFWISISSIDILVGISPGAADGSLVLFSFRITKPQFLPGIFFVVLLYAFWQLWTSWLVQSEEVRNFTINKFGFRATFVVAVICLVLYVVKFANQNIIEIDDFVAWVFIAVFSSIAVAILQKLILSISARLKEKSEGEEIRLIKILVGSRWKLIFNLATGSWKAISFEEGGKIGEGFDENGEIWRIREGTLEILNSRRQVFSRFRYYEPRDRFEHTNNDDTLSMRSQLIEKSQINTETL